MQMVIHRADTRGSADHGWLRTYHSFSFAHWYNPERMGFGALRVFNDDWVEAGKGFGMHGHRDFEIVSIVMRGTVTHQDDLGTDVKVHAGEVQAMSTGTGVIHSEWNKEDEPLELFQIWIEPRQLGVVPRYSQRGFPPTHRQNKLQLLVSGRARPDTLLVHQDTRIFRADLAEGTDLAYALPVGQGVYIFSIDGNATIGGTVLERRDGVGITDTHAFTITAGSDASLILIEVPMR